MTTSFEQTLRKELDDREVGGTAFTKMTEMMDKMDKMMKMLEEKDSLPLNTATTARSEDDGTAFELFGDGFELYDVDDDDILLPLVADEGTIDQLLQQRTSKQLEARQYTIGFHNGKLNPLPASWRYPKGITLIQLINLWLLGGGGHEMYHHWVNCNAAVCSTLTKTQECIPN